jgi:hypothetical protein
MLLSFTNAIHLVMSALLQGVVACCDTALLQLTVACCNANKVAFMADLPCNIQAACTWHTYGP